MQPQPESSKSDRELPRSVEPRPVRDERRFRALVEYAVDGICVLDAEGVVRYANPSCRHVFGTPVDELVGQPLLLRVHDDDRAAFAASLASTLAGGRGVQVDVAFRTQARSGAWLLHDATLRNLLETIDIDALVLTARPFRRSEQVLEQLHQSQRIEALARLAGGVAHDYNNLLTVVTGNAELMLVRPDVSGEARELAEEVAAAAGRAASLTRQLLAFSRQQILRLEPVNVGELVTGAADELRSMIPPSITLVVDTEDGPARVHADGPQLLQALRLMVVNACEAMPGGGQLRVETSVLELTVEAVARHVPMPAGRYVRLRVADTGVGMDAAIRARAFDPFFTTKARGQGRGLGLAMVYGIAKQSGGYIYVDSVPGAGSAFTIYLPVMRTSPGPRAVAPASPRAVNSLPSVLIAEDEDLVRRMASRSLQRAGYRVLAAASGEEALELWRRESGQIDLLLSDIVMPGMDGRTLMATLKTEQPSLAVLLMSGYSASPPKGDAQVAFLPKPFTVDELVHQVRSALARAQHRLER